ncbi:MAG TPA: HD domain-containing phosphohydrolase [Chloroflexota bacterium]|nr:HD domain-containing phosphohydrolase [Chloroflexota bacterium]
MARTKILLADDQDRVRRLVAATLGSAQWELLYAGDGEEALRVAREAQPAIVLLDVTMPKLDGFEVCRRLKGDPATRHMAVVMLTALRDEESRIRANLAGADEYFVKPFSPLALVSRLQELLPASPPAAASHPTASAGARPSGEASPLLSPETPAIVTTLAQTGGAGNTTTITAPEAQQLLAYARDLNQSLEQVRRVYAELERSYLQTIEALAAALDARDSATEGHCQRVTGCTLVMGEYFGIQGAELTALHYGAALHDIGKIGIPDAILRKPGRLTEEEWALMRQHPELGERIIAGIEFLRSAVPVVLHHHERWDGAGYPAGLAGEAIPFGARIFMVSDAFDAMISNRPYRKGMPYEQALREIRHMSGKQFDPAVVEAFEAVFPKICAAPFLQQSATAAV